MAKEIVKVKTKKIMPYIHAVGRRREAVARVRLYPANTKAELNGIEIKKGETVVNGKPLAEYFRFKAHAPEYNKFLLESGVSDKFTVTSKVLGGGIESQLDALILGVARALDKFDHDAYHTTLRQKGYLTRDPRTRERRKVGNAGKARRKKSSPKR